MISSFGSGRAWRYYGRIVLIATDWGRSRIVLALICGPVWRAVGDKSRCQVLVILADFGHADRKSWCQNELPWLPWKSFSICLSMSSSLSFFTLHSFPLRLLLSLPPLPHSLRWTTPHPSLTLLSLPLSPSLSLLQLIAALADYFIQCGPLRASSPGFGRALISHVNIPFIGLNITQHLPPSQRPPGSPCPVRTADYWEG